ncbi:MAG TPA: hypothetical protein GXZ31_01160 [Thermoanaerobacterales bacterium]|nr:hypothetical protein [Thermoanaerobacterales bacterium]
MTLEEIKAIKEAEKQAEEIRAEAQKRAAQIIKEAKDKAEAIITQAVKEGEQERISLIKKAEEDSLKEGKEVKKVYEQKFKALEDQALANMDKAVNFIMERIVTTDGNS